MILNIYKIKWEEFQKCRMGATMVGFLDVNEKPGKCSSPMQSGCSWWLWWWWWWLTYWELTTCLQYFRSLHLSTPVILERALEDKCCYYLHFTLEERERLSHFPRVTQLASSQSSWPPLNCIFSILNTGLFSEELFFQF